MEKASDHREPMPVESNPRTGRWLIVAAAALWSTSGFFAKAEWFDAWPAEEKGLLLAFWRALFAGLFLLPAVRRPRWRPALAPMTLCFTAMNVTYLSAMALTTAANAIWLQNTAPLWVSLLSLFLPREVFDRRNLVPLVLGLAGVLVILGCEYKIGSHPASAAGIGSAGRLPGILLGLAAGVTYAGVVISVRHLRDEDSAWLISLNHLVAAVLMLPWVVALNRWPTLPQLGVLAAFGIVQMAIPYLLFARGLRTVSAPEATMLGLLEPVLLPIWVFLAWGEVPASWTLLGGGFILAGLLLRYLKRP